MTSDTIPVFMCGTIKAECSEFGSDEKDACSGLNSAIEGGIKIMN
jgi:hypothetical protein